MTRILFTSFKLCDLALLCQTDIGDSITYSSDIKSICFFYISNSKSNLPAYFLKFRDIKKSLTGSLFPPLHRPKSQEKFIVLIQDLWRPDCGRVEQRNRRTTHGLHEFSNLLSEYPSILMSPRGLVSEHVTRVNNPLPVISVCRRKLTI